MKVALEFQLPEEREEYENALNGRRYKSKLIDVGECVFRPARKHGYPDPDLNLFIKNLDKLTEGQGTELISKLEDLYIGICNEPMNLNGEY